MFWFILVRRASDSSFYNQTVPSSGCDTLLQSIMENLEYVTQVK